MIQHIYIGTSGWSYRSWEGRFYPHRPVQHTESKPAHPELPLEDQRAAGQKPEGSGSGQFEFYCRHFNSVEINTTFYALPKPAWVQRWAAIAPADFLFSVKGNRSITHERRLAGCGRDLAAFFRSIEPLGARAGVILWQFPPSFSADLIALRHFMRQLPVSRRHAFEFRHRTWFTPQTANLLAEAGGALVAVSAPGTSVVPPVTTDCVYIRFHGLAGGYRHDYTRAELRPWAEYIRAQALAGRKVCAYFNNDAGAHAPANAQLLSQLIPSAGISISPA